jgi:hypothetical protein
MTAAGLEDAEKACHDARAQLGRAAVADDAVKADAWRQAAQRLGHASRVLEGLAAAVTPPDPRKWGVDLSLPGTSRGALLTPGPR